MNNLGIMHGLGDGVPRDDTRAYAWFIVAAQRGDSNAAKNRDLTAGDLARKDREAGQKLAQELSASIP
jgi:TPR repeat protein